MQLKVGEVLDAYEILSPLGVGGMGEVYRARDTRLGRELAIKVLPADVAADPDRRLRFEREARAASALNHPNIVTIYDIGSAHGLLYVAMELVEGDSLRRTLDSGALAPKTALELGAQLADGLAKAHTEGIVHRDVKPENLIVSRDGFVKILDFGLAKTVAQGAGISTLETLDHASTSPGTVLGTVGYMSPEQARGQPVDFRADQFALGAILYEMLTGARAFAGPTTAEALASILRDQPRPIRELSPRVPVALARVVERCLAKRPEDRYASTRALAQELHELRDRLVQPRWLPGAGWLAALLGLGLLLAMLALLRGPATRPGPPAVRLSQVTTAEGIEGFPAFSPDGRSLAYAAEMGAIRKLVVRRLDTGAEQQLTHGDADDIQPAWSPDGQTLLFVRAQKAGAQLEPGDVFGAYDAGDLWSVDVGTGHELKLVANAFNPAWSPDGTRVAVDASWAGPRRLWTVDPAGHNPQQVSSDTTEAVAHLRPRWSPDGKRLVFQNVERTKFDVRVVDLASKALLWVTNDLPQDLNPEWSARFIYFSSNRTGGLNLWRVPVSPEGKPRGALQQLTTGAGQDVELALARQGGRLAFSILKQNADLWQLPVTSQGQPAGTPQPLVATTREESRGAWSPDGKAIAFNSDRSGDMNLWVHSLEAGGADRGLTHGPGGDYQPRWSPDGRTIAFFSSRSGTADIWTLEVGSGRLSQLTHGPSIAINPAFSPDGRQIAFQSDAGGRLEVWVMDADGGRPRALTRVGVTGHFLLWTRDRAGVLFRCPCDGKPQSMIVPLDAGDPEPTAEVAGGSHMSLSPDGSRIIDVVGHKTLWMSPLAGGKPAKVFEFDEPRVRIDYPVWSPDGRGVLFDRFEPQGGDVWLMEGLE